MTQVTEPFPIFHDDDGTPLENGMIYVGEANQDPRTNPVAVFFDEALTVPASQPIRTLGGRPAYQGAPTNLYISEAAYSITVQNRHGSPIVDAADVQSDFVTLNALAASGGSGLVGFIQAGTGAVARTAQAKMRETVSVTDFGAVGNGGGDLGVALQAAHDALGPDGGAIYIPAAASHYRQTTTAAFTKPVMLYGDGWYNSQLLTETSGLVFITSTKWLGVSNLHFIALSAAAETAVFIKHLAASSDHGGSFLEHCFFQGGDRQYWSERTNALYVYGCNFGANGEAGLYLENQTNPDEGDSFIESCTFSGDNTETTSILVKSTSGINIVNCKFNTCLQHINIDTGAGVVGNYLISNNSFEGQVNYGVKIAGNGSGTITKTIITGNQFSATSTDHIIVGADAENTVITGNTFNHTNAAAGRGVKVETGATNVTITGNQFHQILTAVQSTATTMPGVRMEANSFSKDVTNIFLGVAELVPSNSNAVSNYDHIDVSVGAFCETSSDTVADDVFEIDGRGIIEAEYDYIVQGVGFGHAYTRFAMSNGAKTDLDALTRTGANADAVVTLSSGAYLIGGKRATGVGTSVTGTLNLRAQGGLWTVKRV